MQDNPNYSEPREQWQKPAFLGHNLSVGAQPGVWAAGGLPTQERNSCVLYYCTGQELDSVPSAPSRRKEQLAQFSTQPRFPLWSHEKENEKTFSWLESLQRKEKLHACFFRALEKWFLLSLRDRQNSGQLWAETHWPTGQGHTGRVGSQRDPLSLSLLLKFCFGDLVTAQFLRCDRGQVTYWGVS